jgi:hypothetical protein
MMKMDEAISEIVERIREQILDQLDDSGNDWFTSGKVHEIIDIICEYYGRGEDDVCRF